MKGVNKAIQEVMSKMALLEHYQCRLKEDEFEKTWTSFARPLDIFEYQQECWSRLKLLEDWYFDELWEMTSVQERNMDDVKIQLDMIQIIEELPKYEQAAR